ncbi:MAG: hypothetical protein ACTSYD_14070 [Candidatus Heimdallarchaeaceae archaeon]
MSIRRLPPEIYRNLKKLELSAETKSGGVEETLILERPSDDDDPRPYYWFILMLSFGQRSGYVYDRSGLHIPDPEKYVYSVELWKFRGASLRGVETKVNKVEYDKAVEVFQKTQQDLQREGFQVLSY